MVLLNVGDSEFLFPVDSSGLAVAQTPDPGTQPGDPLLVPAHGWVVLSL